MEKEREELHKKIQKLIKEMTTGEVKATSDGDATSEEAALKQMEEEDQAARAAKRRRLEEEKAAEANVRSSIVESVALQREQLELQKQVFSYVKDIDGSILDILHELCERLPQ